MFNIDKHYYPSWPTQRKGIAMKTQRSRNRDLISENVRFAKRFLPQTLSRVLLEQLRELTRNSALSLRCGDLLLLSGTWYVTHTGLLRSAARRRCRGIQVQSIPEFSDATNARYAFKATVYKSRVCQGFVGHGDADPSNVSAVVHGAEMRVAETRAVNRALRKAYGVASARSKKSIPSSRRNRQQNRKSCGHNLPMETAVVREFGEWKPRDSAPVHREVLLIHARSTAPGILRAG